jgi:SpoIID/LytB domain protein
MRGLVSSRLVVTLAAALAGATVAATLPLLPVQAATGQDTPPGLDARGSRLVVQGHGYGHGHGMSQYGAEGAARAGRSARQILRYYYPHTSRDKMGGRTRVLLTADTSPDVIVKPAKSLRVRDSADGRTWRLPTRKQNARMWRITPVSGNAKRSAVQYRNRSGWHRWNLPGGRTVLRGDGQFRARGQLRLVRPGGGVTAYRGSLRSVSPSRHSRTRDTINVVSLDQYVQGVLPSEMPASWHKAALRAQAVAARTYAAWSRRTAGGRHWHVCDSTSCQVYGGVDAEYPSTNSAVRTTARTVIGHRGRPAFSQYSSSSGGWTAAGGKPYLPAKADRWDGWGGNPHHRWRQSLSPRALHRAYPSLGRLKSARVTDRDGHGRWGGRAERVVLRGSRSTVRVSGDDLRWTLGLRSTYFSLDRRRG